MFETEDSSPILVYEDCGFLPKPYKNLRGGLEDSFFLVHFLKQKIPVC